MELPTAPLGGGTACATPRATCVRKYQHGLDVFQEDVSSVSSLKPSLDGSRSRNEGRNDELLGVQGTEGAMRHAVDAPISVAMLVANGDGETAVVGPQQVDHLSGVVARERQRGALARVGRPVLPLFSRSSGVGHGVQRHKQQPEENPKTRHSHSNGLILHKSKNANVTSSK